MTKQKDLAEYKHKHSKRALATAMTKRQIPDLLPFPNMKDATLCAIEQAIRSTDSAPKRKAWRVLHGMMTGKGPFYD